MPGTTSVPTVKVPSWSMVVFGAPAGEGDAPGAEDADAAGDGEAAGDGSGVGSAAAIPANAPQPASISPATTNRAATGAAFELIVRQSTQPFGRFIAPGSDSFTHRGPAQLAAARGPSTDCVPRPSSKVEAHGQRPRQSAHTSCRARTSGPHAGCDISGRR